VVWLIINVISGIKYLDLKLHEFILDIIFCYVYYKIVVTYHE